MKRIILSVPFALLLCFSGILRAQSLTQAEYFYDTDPGVGHGTPVTINTPSDSENLDIHISSGSLTSGWHYLFFRFRDSLGVWGENTWQSFYISNSFIDTAANGSPKISAAEYFIDADPGVGLGTAYTAFTASDSVNINQVITTGALATGFHYLYTRFQYSDGVWGNTSLSQSFYVSPGTIDTAANSSPEISAAEFFIDSDPGVGLGTPYSAFTQADSVNITQYVPAGSLSTGFHYFYTRFGYTNAVWGQPTVGSFYVINPSTQDTSPPINYAEYFFDTDPGAGNGTSVPVSPNTDSANLTLANVSTAGLGSGMHILYFRFRYTNGVWGLYQPQGDTISICNPPVVHITAGGPASFCTGGSVTLQSDTSSVYHYQWQRNSSNVTGDTLSSLRITDSSGVYDVVVTDSGCPGISDSITVTINAPSSYSYSQSICQGQNVNFNGHVLTATGTYYDTLANAHGCDSITTLHLTVSSSIQINITGSICPGGSYPFNGQNLTHSGIFHDTAASSGGCDSITTLTLTLYSATTTQLNGSICQGSSYFFKGQNLDTSGVYMDTLSSIHGCDSILVLTLTENYPTYDTISESICQGGSYYFNETNLTAAGTYNGTFTASNNCDSFVTLYLQVLAQVTDSVSDSICAGSTYSFNGRNLDSAGMYMDTLTATGGCDSIVTLQLTVKPLPMVSLSWDSLVKTQQLRLYQTDTMYCTFGKPTLFLYGGNPPGGLYTGTGVSGDTLYGGITFTSGNALDTITYTASMDGCHASASDTLRIEVCEGINTLSLGALISLYPNPAMDMLVVQSSLFTTNYITPQLYDVTGKLITTTNVTRESDAFTFDTRSLSSGVYFIKLNIAGDEVVKRFVKID